MTTREAAHVLCIGINRVRERSTAGQKPSILLRCMGNQDTRVYEREQLRRWMRRHRFNATPDDSLPNCG